MKYKGYQGMVTYDDEAKIFHGEVIGLKDVITFQGTSVDDLEQAFKDSVDDYVEFCKKKKRTPEKPFSGHLLLRVSPEIHKEATVEAKNRGISLNAFLNEVISKEIHKPHTHHKRKA
ncbi:MAG: type II toxin-antitoxin system HicB family antitoxin [Thermodesulfobacteriota bacterium]